MLEEIVLYGVALSITGSVWRGCGQHFFIYVWGMRVYLEKVGYRDSITDKEEIIWYWTQKAKFHPYKSHQTKYWINLHEMYKDSLVKSESFELLNFLKSKVTDEQLKNRKLWKEKQKVQSEKELEKWKQFAVDYAEEKKLKSSLKNLN